jgi:SAM-dependent methyltransferase
MDAEQLEFQSGYFDRVLCGFALFFLPRLEDALAEFHRVLRPGGACAASTFGKDDEQFRWYEALLAKYGISRQVPVARQLDNPGELHSAFFEAGFSDIRVVEERFDCEYTDEEDWWSHLWSTADRAALESLSEANLRALRKDALAGIRTLERDGKIRVPYHVLFTLAAKSQESFDEPYSTAAPPST